MDFDYRLCKNLCKCMHPLLKSGGAEAPPAPPSATPLINPVRASKQGNVIGLVSIYIYVCVCVQKQL